MPPDRADDVDLLRSFAAHSRELFSAHDPVGTYRYVSPNYAAVLGYPAASLIGRHPDELVHPEDAAPTRAAVLAVADHGEPTTLRYRLRDSSGRYRWFESTVHRAITTPDGGGSPRADGFRIISRDIDQRVAAEAAQERRRDLAEVLMRLAIGFVNAPTERVDAAIDELLEVTGRATGAAGAVVYRYRGDPALARRTHRWGAGGPAPSLPLTGAVGAAAARHARGAAALATYPLEEPDDTGALGATIASVPLLAGTACLGFVGLELPDDRGTSAADAATEGHGEDTAGLSDEDLGLLRVVAELITNLLLRHDHEAALAQSRSLLGIAGAVAGFGGWMWDLDAQQTLWSEELTQLLGAAPGTEPDFGTLLAGCHPDDRRQLEQATLAAIQQGTPWDLELRVTQPDGHERWLRNVGRAERAADGRTVRLWGAVQDITPQRRARREAELLAARLTATMDSVTDSIVVLDHDTRVTYVNTQATRVFGLPAEQLVGRPLTETVPEEVGGVFHQAEGRAWATGEPQSVTGHFASRGVWLEASFYPSSEGLTIYVRDVTARVEREQMLEQMAAAERATAARLQQLDHVKTTFLTAVSHELRTPLTVVRGMAETLQRLRGQGHDEHRAALEDALVNHAQQLTGLVEELLHIDRLSRGAMTSAPRWIDVAEVTRQVANRSPIAGRLALEVPETFRVALDPVQYEQLLRNLLGNTAKYAPDGPVTLRLTPREPDGIRLELRDRGPGIPTDSLEAVFDPFVRLEHDHPKPGTGVGLTLVRELARLHGGHAWAKDTGGDGAWIVVELPGNPPGPP